MHAANLLGEYLRACRERVSPAELGLQSLGPRRVAGLRREEVATSAGISSDYYLRLEQGRDRHPSRQVLDSLAQTLRLDPTEAAHLLALGGSPDGPGSPATGTPTVPDSIAQLVQALDLPAFVQDRHFDVLASNAMARALSPTLRPGQNRLLSVFLDSQERALFVDWALVAAQLVASFRASVAADAADRRTSELVSELSARDPFFRDHWARYALADRVDRPPVRFAHPVAGVLTLMRENLAVDGPAALRLMIYHAPHGSLELGALRRLRGAAASG